jgi:hypothetical protein
MSCRLDQLPPAAQEEFKQNALHAMPMWKDTVPIAKEHLKSPSQPVARVGAQLSSSRSKNHAKEELNLPLHAALALGAKVALWLRNICSMAPLENLSLALPAKIPRDLESLETSLRALLLTFPSARHQFKVLGALQTQLMFPFQRFSSAVRRSAAA